MSTKKPTFFEVHCEKILVAILSLFLVSITVWQLVFLQIDVKVGSESVGLVELEKKLEKKDREVSQKLDPTNPLQIEIPEQKKLPSSEIFQRERVVGLAPQSTLPLNEPSFSGLLVGGSISNNQWFYEPNFVAAKMGGVSITSDAVDLSQLSAEDLKLEFLNQFCLRSLLMWCGRLHGLLSISLRCEMNSREAILLLLLPKKRSRSLG